MIIVQNFLKVLKPLPSLPYNDITTDFSKHSKNAHDNPKDFIDFISKFDDETLLQMIAVHEENAINNVASKKLIDLTRCELNVRMNRSHKIYSITNIAVAITIAIATVVIAWK